jgi:alpha-beta hydrolase superfamily lysophospholipase
MPGYGCTRVSEKNKTYSYDEWVQVASDFVDHELEHDPRPIVLYGLSAGGMLTYHVASLNKNVRGIIGMTFLDMRLQKVADQTARNMVMSRAGMPLAKLANVAGLHWLKMPMSLASKMHTLVNDKDVLEIFLKDKTSAGSSASMRFLASYCSYRPVLEPEEFDVCPVLLTQPSQDRWTPLPLSKMVLGRMARTAVKIVGLENAGHYPLEEPGLTQMADAIADFLRSLE